MVSKHNEFAHSIGNFVVFPICNQEGISSILYPYQPHSDKEFSLQFSYHFHGPLFSPHKIFPQYIPYVVSLFSRGLVLFHRIPRLLRPNLPRSIIGSPGVIYSSAKLFLNPAVQKERKEVEKPTPDSVSPTTRHFLTQKFAYWFSKNSHVPPFLHPWCFSV